MPEIIVKLGDSIVQKNIFVKETIRIGRVPDNEIVVENLAISRYHAVIEHEDGHYLLSDLDSSNGTFVNGVRIKKTELQDRDVITIGKHKLYFYDHRAAAEFKPRPITAESERTMVIDAAPSQGELEVLKGRQAGERFLLSGVQTSIGKGSFNDIQLTDWFVSKVHAVIERHGSEFVIRDMGSWRHTFINGVMTQEVALADGDTIQLGPSVQLTFRLARPGAGPAAARVPVELTPATPRPSWSPEQAEPLGEETAKAWGPRYVEWHDPDEAAAPLGTRDRHRLEAVEPEAGEPAGQLALEDQAQAAPQGPDLAAFTANEPNGSLASAQAWDEGTLDLADEEPEATPEAAPEAPQQANEPPANIFGARQRTALEELATALGLDDEPAAPPQNDPAAGQMAPEPAPEPIKIWTASPEVFNNEPDPEPDELPLERPEEVPEPAPEEEESPFPRAGEAPIVAPVPTPAPAGRATAETDPEILREILMWERALKNKNPIIRKQAARQLLKLTGKEYDYS